MKIQKMLQENAKFFDRISEETFASLKKLDESVMVFADSAQFEDYKVLVKEGYVEKSYRKYTLTSKGQGLVEAYELYSTNPKKFALLTENIDSSNKIVISYKKHEFETNTIVTEQALFDIEVDGLPVVIVSEEAYSLLIHRTKGTHWKQYLGEEGRQLVRQKKLSKFYVQDENTGRKYLYILP